MDRHAPRRAGRPARARWVDRRAGHERDGRAAPGRNLESLDDAMRQELEAFVLREARLLDERRYAAWLELFAEDGVYWIPTRPDQRSQQDALSIIYEPRALLAVRVERLERGEMPGQAPPPPTGQRV